ncbi:MAG: hypothetical protein NTW49_04720 [Bacteroidia bacterium]|nr:hypothetical protein [Bacteroidia bacterium]
MIKYWIKLHLLISLLCIVIIISCKKEHYNDNGYHGITYQKIVNLSNQTLDTLIFYYGFGGITQSKKYYNLRQNDTTNLLSVDYAASTVHFNIYCQGKLSPGEYKWTYVIDPAGYLYPGNYNYFIISLDSISNNVIIAGYHE